MTDWAIRARGLGKQYKLYAHPFDRLKELLSPTRKSYHQGVWALRDLDMDIPRGTITGLVGVNGAGKSTLLKLIAGGLTPSAGTLEAQGRISSILELGTGFQPYLTGRQNAFVNALFLGLRPWEVESKIEQILEFADLGAYANQPLSTYSSGMGGRLAFAVITTIEPEILVLDEALATGDGGFAEKCKQHIRKLCDSGCTTIVASHGLPFIRETCDRVFWIDHGRVQVKGPPDYVVDCYEDFLGIRHSLPPLPEPLPPGTPPPATRPRSLVLKIESTAPERQHSYIVYGFAWRHTEARDCLVAYPLGIESAFEKCVTATIEAGFSETAARAGWGPSQDLTTRFKCRACRPDLGPGRAAYLAVPLPPHPEELPAFMRIRFFQSEVAPDVIISILGNGRFHELTRLKTSNDPWPTVDVDIRAALAAEGQIASPLDPQRFFLPESVAL